MIILPGADARLEPAEQFALTLLVDLSRLLPMEDRGADVVRLELVDASGAQDVATFATRGYGITRADGVVRIERTALGVTARIATADRERASGVRDRLGRVPPSENELVIAERERDPVISRAALALRDAVISAAGRRPVRLAIPWPGGKRWAVALTHDVDIVTAWPLFTALRLLELARKGDVRRAASVSASALAAIASAPVRDGVRAVLEREGTLRSTWFVLCGTPTLATFRRGDLTYRPESRGARAIVDLLAHAGAEIALHGSAETTEREAAFVEQRARLGRITGRAPVGVRQHFLRMQLGATERAMARAGFAYDSTMGFYDRNGFRLGVADVVPAFGGGQGSPSSLAELPFCWMDRALSKYHGDERPEAWIEDALALAATCREVEGAWVGIWHPNLTAPLGYPGALRAYERLVEGLLADEPYVGTAEELVRWRDARRGLRVRALRPDGSVELGAASGDAARFALEDARADARERAAP